MHYLDDFLLVDAPGSQDCAHSINTFLTTCDCLGVLIAWDKLEAPTIVLIFLGKEIDTQAMQIRLPEARLTERSKLITVWRGKQSCKRKQ